MYRMIQFVSTYVLFCLIFCQFAYSAKQTIDFNHDIKPILVAKCFECHGPDPETRKADLRLDLEKEAKKIAIIPGYPEKSKLIEVISAEDVDDLMPPKKSGKTLKKSEIELLRKWIKEGAPYAKNWSFSMLLPKKVPEVKQKKWPKGDLDKFILSRLEKENLNPADDADKRVLLRRLTFDLIGLPPSTKDIEDFVNDTSEKAYDKVVDRLLASKHFGERWGRHWLDMVRYAETFGYEGNYVIPLAWRYRDYVIRMFNEDVPYDQIVREHIAGDLLKQPRKHPKQDFNESVIGTGFWYLHGQMSQPVDVMKHESDRFDNQLDTLNRGFFGMTMACARCHDHKFDPISAEDYYGLVGFLRSSRRQEAYLDPGDKIAKKVKELKEVRHQAEITMKKLAREKPVLVEPKKLKHVKMPESVLFENFEHDFYRNWFVYGEAFGDGPSHPFQSDSKKKTVSMLKNRMANSGVYGAKLRGNLQSRDFIITHPRIWFRVSGKGTIRVIINGYMMQRHRDLLFAGTQLKVDVKGNEFVWLEIAKDLKNYVGHRAYLEIVDDSDGMLMVDEIRFSKHKAPGGKTFIESKSFPASHFVEFSKRTAELEKGLARPMQVLAMGEGTPADESVRIRGDVRKIGKVVARRMPVSFVSFKQTKFKDEDGSGRLELANRMVSPSNPLTARVRVNWIWHHLFGRGIVESVDNFGAMGKAPTHPQLLDHLSYRFSHKLNWSMKKIIREIVLSRTYQMSSTAKTKNNDIVDPTNELLHRMRVNRLEGEVLRDSILAISGRLDKTSFGKSVPVHLTPFMQGINRPKKSGPLDGKGRRSIYLEVNRNFLSPFFMTFDMPTPTVCKSKRNSSNVPAQALIMMNNPLVSQQAELWAKSLVKTENTVKSRIEHMFLKAYARSAFKEEIKEMQTFLKKQADVYKIPDKKIMKDVRLWSDMAHSFFMLKEFQYVR